jgi:hypothetical protein
VRAFGVTQCELWEQRGEIPVPAVTSLQLYLTETIKVGCWIKLETRMSMGEGDKIFVG